MLKNVIGSDNISNNWQFVFNQFVTKSIQNNQNLKNFQQTLHIKSGNSSLIMVSLIQTFEVNGASVVYNCAQVRKLCQFQIPCFGVLLTGSWIVPKSHSSFAHRPNRSLTIMRAFKLYFIRHAKSEPCEFQCKITCNWQTLKLCIGFKLLT